MDKQVKEYYKLANKYNTNGKITEAIEYYKKVLNLNKKHTKSLTELGKIYSELNNYNGIIDCYQQIININPNVKDANRGILLCELGVAYTKINNYTEGLKIFKKILEIKNDIPDVYNNIAICYVKLKQYKHSENILLKSICLRNDVAVNNMLGELYFYTKQYDKSIKHYSANPNIHNNPLDLYNLCFPYLAKKDFKTGFSLYENRLKNNNIHPQTGEKERVELPWIPDWNGINTCNNLLVIYEQGIGDNIMYYRFIMDLANKYPNMKITYFCKNTISHILNDCNKITIINNYSNGTNDYEYKIFIMSLPYILKINSILPNKENYILTNNVTTAYWKNLLDNLPNKKSKNIGFFYSGLLFSFIDKSIPLQKFDILLDLDVNLICLHKESDLLKDLPSISNELNERIIHYNIDNELPFTDTIAILQNLDLLITIDTSLCHLAGVLNIPTLLLLGYGSDWRWFDNNNKVWYNSVEILRLKENKELFNILPEAKQKVIELCNL